MTKPTTSFLASGFVLATILRLLTSSLLIVIPLFISGRLGLGATYTGLYVVLLWVGNAVGALGAVAVIKRHSDASLVGFLVLTFSLFGLTVMRAGGSMDIFTVSAGAGLGMAQPFLAALMHMDSDGESSFRGIGLYSAALGVGLVLGPLLASSLLTLYDFPAVFMVLALLSAVAFVEVLTRRMSVKGLPLEEFALHALSPTQVYRAFRVGRFKAALSLNFLYSLLLPNFLSFGAIYGEFKFGIGPSEALLIFSAVFVFSTTVRVMVVMFPRGLNLQLAAAAALLLCSVVITGVARSLPEFLVGMLLFGIPHALLLPITNFEALRSVDRDTLMNASYTFQASSGAAEVISPVIAVAVISTLGISELFVAMVPIALLAVVLAVYISRTFSTALVSRHTDP